MENVNARDGNFLCRWLVAAALALLSLNAWALRDTDKTAELNWQTSGNSSTGVPSRGGPGKTFEYGTSGGKATFKTPTKPLPWPGKSQAEYMAKWKQAASPAGMAKSILRPGGFVPLLAGSALTLLLNEACVRLAGGTMQLADGAAWEECKFGDATMYRLIQVPAGMERLWSSSRSSLCAQVRAQLITTCNANFGGSCPSTYVEETSQPSCVIKSMPSGITAFAEGYETEVQENQPTGEYEGRTELQIEPRLTDKLTTWCNGGDTAACAAVAQGLVESGATVKAEDALTLEGPATAQGSPQVTKTTRTDGGTTTVTVTTTYNYTYEGNKVTVTTTTSTNTVNHNPDGSTTTENKSDEKKDERTKCEKEPDSIECSDKDVPDENVPKTTKDIIFTPDIIGLGGGSCPAPVGWTDRLGTHSLNLQPVCDITVSVIKPVLLAMAALIALMIATPGIKD